MGFLNNNRKSNYEPDESVSKHQQTMDDICDIYAAIESRVKSPEVAALLAIGTIVASTMNGRMVQLVRAVNEANGPVSADPLNRIDNRHS